MENLFSIRLNNPEYVLPRGKGHGFQSVFSTCFEYPTENLELIWHTEVIPFEYRYEVPYLLYLLLEMINNLSAADHGEFTEFVGMDTYQFNWKFTWNKNNLKITADWEEMRHHNLLDQLEITVEHFLNESMKLVRFLSKHIQESGVQIVDSYYNKRFLYNLERQVRKRLRILQTQK